MCSNLLSELNEEKDNQIRHGSFVQEDKLNTEHRETRENFLLIRFKSDKKQHAHFLQRQALMEQKTPSFLVVFSFSFCRFGWPRRIFMNLLIQYLFRPDLYNTRNYIPILPIIPADFNNYYCHSLTKHMNCFTHIG